MDERSVWGPCFLFDMSTPAALKYFASEYLIVDVVILLKGAFNRINKWQLSVLGLEPWIYALIASLISGSNNNDSGFFVLFWIMANRKNKLIQK